MPPSFHSESSKRQIICDKYSKSTKYLWYKITPSFHRLPIEKDQRVEE